jgi:predicted transcriptional regulator of viral defense system
MSTLLESKVIHEIRLSFPSRNYLRYLFNNPSDLEVALSINPVGYFSHFTAMHVLGLTDQIPKTIYLNVEQKISPGGGELDQEAIHRTFRRPCRVTHNTTTYERTKITVLNGGNTGCLGVIGLQYRETKSELRVTGFERTLIDATVRPNYSGGVFEVARAFRAARGQVSIDKLVKMLRKISYTYPYHQAIGFYLEREGYDPADVELLRNFPIEYEFYLDYAMRQTQYNPRWRLHIPKGF